MGKGDRRTRRGKIVNGSYGVARMKKSKKRKIRIEAAKKAAAK
ncbi:MAG: 30S ribosomal protein THX [Rhodothermales bacterium]